MIIMYYSSDVIEEIRFNNNIVDVISSYINLKQKGNSYFGLCPFHNEATPSFSVNESKQLYHCFGCGASGNVISFIMNIENCDFVEAIQILASRINYEFPIENTYKNKNSSKKNILYDIHALAGRFYYENLKSEKGINARNYLEKRKIKNNTVIRYGLGYATSEWDSLYKYLISKNYSLEDILGSGLVIKSKNNKYFDRFRDRLMFPIINTIGKVVGFGGRIISDSKNEPKYLNSPETLIFDKSQNLYSLNFARKSGLKEFILVEGYVDVITLYQNGIHNVIASLGTAFNDNHAKFLKKFTDSLILCFDNDNAGIEATLRAIPKLSEQGFKIKVITLNNAKDPDEFIRIFGIDAFKEKITNAKSHILFQINILLKSFNLSNLEEKIMFTNKVAKILSSVNSEIELDVYIKEISNITGISVDAIKHDIYIKNNIPKKNAIKSYNKTINKKQNNYNAIDKAKISLIYLLANYKKVYKGVNTYITPEEFENEIYIKIVQNIYDLYKTKDFINLAEIVSYFESKEDQQSVAEILNLNLTFEDEKSLEKIVNDQIKIIKKHYIDKKITEIDDMAIINKLLDQKRKLEDFFIILH